MNLNSPPDAEQFVDSLVASGQFASAEAAIEEGVRLLMRREALREDIREAVVDLDAGRGVDGEIVFAELRERASQIEEREH